MRGLYFLFMVACLTSETLAQSCSVKYNGLYVTKEAVDEHGNLRYLRFYEDGTVLSLYSEETITEVAKWFSKDIEDLPKGDWKIKECEISFSTKNSSGKFSYKGTVKGDILHLFKTLPNKEKHELKYQFNEIKVK